MSILYTIASTLRDTVVAGLPGTLGGLPTKLRSCIVPGELAWDDCECGLVGVEFTGTAYSQVPPTPEYQRDGGCKPYVVANFNISVIRCVPGPTQSGSGPSCAKLDTAAQILMDDTLMLMKATSIALETLFDSDTILGFAMSGVTTVGPQGLCAGVAQQVSAYVTNLYAPCD